MGIISISAMRRRNSSGDGTMISYNDIKRAADRRYYLARDLRFFNYQYDEIGDFYFRKTESSWNPGASSSLARVNGGARIAFLGAAQIFGVYTDLPVPERVARRFGAQCLNLGAGGAGPEFFLTRPHLIDFVNQCDVCVVQFMAARSVSFRDYVVSPFASNHIRKRGDAGPYEDALKVLARLWSELDYADRASLADELRTSYVEKVIALLSKIKVPKILLWMAHRHPEMGDEPHDKVEKWWGYFPFLVDTKSFDALVPYAESLAYAVTPPEQRSLTTTLQKMRCSANGAKTNVTDTYYPSEALYSMAASETERVLVEKSFLR